ncbi:polysaccharide deacetylase family protein [Arundinibacter roseus]|uniref:ChbG/HpnK family deacetylase n=1 Tax=Arundinibacter roseus TaxID=2070510 RepID=A0A4R4KL04_9BACT|nr:polysaccharide deacetylase family protein [Arundinibacter roseus]TDB68990.1 ChbG/HpnK family deacetylase [Arundinibacter roseus]
MIRLFSYFLVLVTWFPAVLAQGPTPTYAEQLGFPAGKKVIIMHVDDVGMSYDSNEGAIQAIRNGVATSLSVMMPCAWVPGFVHYLKQNPDLDAGLHLTMTSEWKDYRWGPLAGKPTVKGLVDTEGALWPSVADVVKNASPDEVETEIRAQLERARTMGFEPTHMDSHMGTLFATPAFLQRYIKVGIEEKIPVMFPGGHNTAIRVDERMSGDMYALTQTVGKQLWAAGLPVLDDLHNVSYGWKLPEDPAPSKEKLQAFKTQKYIDGLASLKPGLTMVIMHCTDPTEVFPIISGSTQTREGDLLAMIDPKLKAYIEKEGIILTTFREVMQRRQRVK